MTRAASAAHAAPAAQPASAQRPEAQTPELQLTSIGMGKAFYWWLPALLGLTFPYLFEDGNVMAGRIFYGSCFLVVFTMLTDIPFWMSIGIFVFVLLLSFFLWMAFPDVLWFFWDLLTFNPLAFWGDLAWRIGLLASMGVVSTVIYSWITRVWTAKPGRWEHTSARGQSYDIYRQEDYDYRFKFSDLIEFFLSWGGGSIEIISRRLDGRVVERVDGVLFLYWNKDAIKRIIG